MTEEFRTAKGWRIIVYITAPILIVSFCLVAALPFFADEFSWFVALLLVPTGIGLSLLFIYGILETSKGRVIVGADYISQQKPFRTETLSFHEIRGYRLTEYYLNLLPFDSSKKIIQINRYFERYGNIQAFIMERFPDLDMTEAVEEEMQLLENDALGITPQFRAQKLQEVRTISKYVNIIGSAIAGWALFYPKPYELSMVACMVVPVISLIIVYFFRGLIRLDETKNSAHPSIVYALLFSSFAIALRALFDYELFDFSGIWVPTILMSCTLTGMALFVSNEIKFNKWTDTFRALSFLIIFYAYTYGAYVVSNCLLDRSEPKVFGAKVLDKEESDGQTTTYYLKLSPWGPRTQAEKVSVTRQYYDEVAKGDSVDVHLRNGYLGTPWIEVVLR